jgi:hypothetical protein
MPDVWRPLRDELALWHDAGRTAGLWLRDDDAAEPCAALDRLLEVTGRHQVPLTLAVIPAATGEGLATRLATEAHANVAVHGWAHANHALAGQKKQELGAHRSLETVLRELARAKAVIDELFAGKALPILVPPWNRIDETLLGLLSGLGFVALSVFGRAKPAPLKLVNTHVDLIDWHGGRAGKAHGELVADLVGELSSRRQSGSVEPIGMLTHHLVHDEQAWAFLQALFDATSGRDGCRWVAARELI